MRSSKFPDLNGDCKWDHEWMREELDEIMIWVKRDLLKGDKTVTKSELLKMAIGIQNSRILTNRA